MPCLKANQLAGGVGWIRMTQMKWWSRWRGSIVMAADMALVVVAALASSAMAPVGDGSPLQAVFSLQFLPILGLAFVLHWWRRVWAIQPRYVAVTDFLSIFFIGLTIGLYSRINASLFTQIELSQGWDYAIIFTFFYSLFVAGWRLLRRMQTSGWSPLSDRSRPTKRVLIVGAFNEGESVYRELMRLPDPSLRVIGYVDDAAELRNTTLHGLPILGSIEQVGQIAEERKINEILIARGNLSPTELRRIFTLCGNTRARIRLVPSFASIVGGDDRLFGRAQSFNIQDILRRDPIFNENESIELDFLNGERVLITGGGGSIGSELARQVTKRNPASLVLLGRGEGSILGIEQELWHKTPLRPFTIIADVRDRQRLDFAMQTQFPTVVFHAAAYKHASLMESAPIEVIRNNVFGTLNTVEASIAAKVKKFILVSTDKAERPANVVGATKRVAEMIAASVSQRSDTRFSIVRLGDVLGTRGSLVPLVQQQIADGGPVAITHPEMTRYFMTIPEAAELILYAGAMGRRGETFVLDTGEPIKIEELIRDIIRMSGLMPDQDIGITYTGLRPGEVLHSESNCDAKT